MRYQIIGVGFEEKRFWNFQGEDLDFLDDKEWRVLMKKNNKSKYRQFFVIDYDEKTVKEISV